MAVNVEETYAFFRLIEFGFPNQPVLSDEDLIHLFETIEDNRPYICVTHDPAIERNLQHDYDQFHYHLLTRRQVKARNIWTDPKWNMFMEKIDNLGGWMKILICPDLRQTLANFKMPGKELCFDRMDIVMQNAWSSITSKEIIEQSQNLKDKE